MDENRGTMCKNMGEGATYKPRAEVSKESNWRYSDLGLHPPEIGKNA